MDPKRPINADKISDSGVTICKCGRFKIYLTHDGDFKVVDEVSGVIIEHLSASDTHDLSDASHTVEEWGLYHHIVKK